MQKMGASRIHRYRVAARLGLAAAIVGTVLALPATASASTGCQALNQASLDGLYFGKEITLSALTEGDVVRISAGFPTRPIPPATDYVPTGLFLQLNESAFRGATFPGTIEWVVHQDFDTPPRMRWVTNQDNETGHAAEVTWAISCQDAPPPPDTDPPSVTIDQATAQADPTNSSPIQFTVHFDEAVTGFDGTDVSLSGSAGATTATVSGEGGDYTASVTGMTGSGQVVASIGAGAATDAAGNASTASTSTDNSVTYDITPPVLSLPADIVVDATSSDGAAVTYSATATDNGGTPSLSCSPVSGSTFPIGTTAVSCTATDAATNNASGGFTVTVQDVAAQIEDLAVEAEEVGPGKSLGRKAREAQRAEAAGDISRACSLLSDFIKQVKAQRGKSLTTAQADALTGDAARIRSLLGC